MAKNSTDNVFVSYFGCLFPEETLFPILKLLIKKLCIFKHSFKLSSNSELLIAWITRSTTSPSRYMVFEIP